MSIISEDIDKSLRGYFFDSPYRITFLYDYICTDCT